MTESAEGIQICIFDEREILLGINIHANKLGIACKYVGIFHINFQSYKICYVEKEVDER